VARATEPRVGAPDLHVAAPVDEPLRRPAPVQWAEPPPAGGQGVPGYARLIAGADEARATRDEAQAELARRREDAEREAAAYADRPEEIPGLGGIGLELTIAALRLARTLVTAPLRIALAFLRPREAM
jgi:hypothetical protein